MITCDMARRNNLPKYEYLYRRIRHDVRAGLLAADERLPPAFPSLCDAS